MVIDPPFGGMVEALAASIGSIEKTWQEVSGRHYKNLPMQYTENFFQKQKLKISLEKF